MGKQKNVQVVPDKPGKYPKRMHSRPAAKEYSKTLRALYSWANKDPLWLREKLRREHGARLARRMAKALG